MSVRPTRERTTWRNHARHVPLEIFLNRRTKLESQSFLIRFVSRNGIVKLLFRNSTQDQAAFHLPYFASSFALTSSQETTSSGLSRWSWSRRSIKAASPGVSSWEPVIPSRRSRHSSMRSDKGSARASLKTISELMSSNYRNSHPNQATNKWLAALNSALRTPHSALT